MFVYLSVCPWGYLWNHMVQFLINFLCMLPMAVARSFPIVSALYRIAFGTHTKTAEPIEMPFGMMSGLGPCNTLLVRNRHPLQHCMGVMIPEEEKPLLGENVPTSLTFLQIANWTGPCSAVHMIGADAWLWVLDESIISHDGGGIAHCGRSLISTIACFVLAKNLFYFLYSFLVFSFR